MVWKIQLRYICKHEKFYVEALIVKTQMKNITTGHWSMMQSAINSVMDNIWN